MALIASFYGKIQFLNFNSTTYTVHNKSLTNSNYDKNYILSKYYNDMIKNLKFVKICFKKFNLKDSVVKKLEFREKYLYVRR